MVEETKIANVKEQVGDLNLRLTTYITATDKSLIDITTARAREEERITNFFHSIKELKQTITNMEKRMTAIETKIWLWAGGLTAIAMLLTYIVKGIKV